MKKVIFTTMTRSVASLLSPAICIDMQQSEELDTASSLSDSSDERHFVYSSWKQRVTIGARECTNSCPKLEQSSFKRLLERALKGECIQNCKSKNYLFLPSRPKVQWEILISN